MWPSWIVWMCIFKFPSWEIAICLCPNCYFIDFSTSLLFPSGKTLGLRFFSLNSRVILKSSRPEVRLYFNSNCPFSTPFRKTRAKSLVFCKQIMLCSTLKKLICVFFHSWKKTHQNFSIEKKLLLWIYYDFSHLLELFLKYEAQAISITF